MTEVDGIPSLELKVLCERDAVLTGVESRLLLDAEEDGVPSRKLEVLCERDTVLVLTGVESRLSLDVAVCISPESTLRLLREVVVAVSLGSVVLDFCLGSIDFFRLHLHRLQNRLAL